ncbi:MAG: hypothetical protein ACXWB9_01575 [Flavisolibacter sp.]
MDSTLEKKVKNILVIINGQHPDQSSIKLGCELARMVNASLTGLFVSGPPEAPQLEDAYLLPEGNVPKLLHMDTEQAIKLFRHTCESRDLPHEMRMATSMPIEEAIEESRFADLLVVPPDLSLLDLEVSYPSLFVKLLLRKAECPILLAPVEFDGIDEIVFCFDGSRSAVFAIKQFTYLFPGLHHRKVLLLEVIPEVRHTQDEKENRMMDWLRSYYTDVHHQSLVGEARDELFTYFFMKQKRLIVMGAFGRSWLSGWFKKSSAQALIKNIDLPLFITHL